MSKPCPVVTTKRLFTSLVPLIFDITAPSLFSLRISFVNPFSIKVH